MTRDEFAATYRVMPDAMVRLDAYTMMLTDWQSRMNLVAASPLPDLWQRHVADSAQLAALAPKAVAATTWLDIGSGAGFPALVLAVLCPGTFHLVEARVKKCAFLHAAAEGLGVAERVVIHAGRIEELPTIAADVVTARAAASLTQLFTWGERFAHDACWLLPKGRTVAAELSTAKASFDFDHRLIASRTAADARIVVARNVRRRRR